MKLLTRIWSALRSLFIIARPVRVPCVLGVDITGKVVVMSDGSLYVLEGERIVHKEADVACWAYEPTVAVEVDTPPAYVSEVGSMLLKDPSVGRVKCIRLSDGSVIVAVEGGFVDVQPFDLTDGDWQPRTPDVIGAMVLETTEHVVDVDLRTVTLRTDGIVINKPLTQDEKSAKRDKSRPKTMNLPTHLGTHGPKNDVAIPDRTEVVELDGIEVHMSKKERQGRDEDGLTPKPTVHVRTFKEGERMPSRPVVGGVGVSPGARLFQRRVDAEAFESLEERLRMSNIAAAQGLAGLEKKDAEADQSEHTDESSEPTEDR